MNTQSSAEKAQRNYSPEEHAAFRAVSRREWGDSYVPGRGPAEFATGDYWPDALEQHADAMERLIPKFRLAARALRREIASENGTPPGNTNAAAARPGQQ